MSTEPVESVGTQLEGETMDEKFGVGTFVRYVSEKGFAKAGQVTHTHDSVPEDGVVARPEPGFAHLAVWNMSTGHYIPYANIPFRDMAETIPDYTIEGQLVGFFEVAR